ncbi:uncharacterized protein EI90DRAFT_3121135 [Cantharellus anzutake]|uniref:uncharacterized protein n=1 Tax=Cantharellus anzutake TaxID=1750568 RepID=UPI001905ED3F|nr:uncharacterized protein EI90DRAFT_3121135 [Cantharellus anzutake]KAF8334702.1 hypothetical protein EI90DRAFT_3121135 [Cantharellus anzutake]
MSSSLRVSPNVAETQVDTHDSGGELVTCGAPQKETVGSCSPSCSPRQDDFHSDEPLSDSAKKDDHTKEVSCGGPIPSDSCSQPCLLTIGTLISPECHRRKFSASHSKSLSSFPTRAFSSSSLSSEASTVGPSPSNMPKKAMDARSLLAPPALMSPATNSIWPWDARPTPSLAFPPSPCVTPTREFGILHVIPQTPAPGEPKQEPFDYFTGYFLDSGGSSSSPLGLSATEFSSTSPEFITRANGSGSQLNSLPKSPTVSLQDEPSLSRGPNLAASPPPTLTPPTNVAAKESKPLASPMEGAEEKAAEPTSPPSVTNFVNSDSDKVEGSKLRRPPSSSQTHSSAPPVKVSGSSLSKVSRPPKRFATFRPSAREQSAWAAVARGHSLLGNPFSVGSFHSLDPADEESRRKRGSRAIGPEPDSNIVNTSGRSLRPGSVLRPGASVPIDSVLSSLGSFHQPLSVTLTYDPTHLEKEAQLVKSVKHGGALSPGKLKSSEVGKAMSGLDASPNLAENDQLNKSHDCSDSHLTLSSFGACPGEAGASPTGPGCSLKECTSSHLETASEGVSFMAVSPPFLRSSFNAFLIHASASFSHQVPSLSHTLLHSDPPVFPSSSISAGSSASHAIVFISVGNANASFASEIE